MPISIDWSTIFNTVIGAGIIGAVGVQWKMFVGLTSLNTWRVEHTKQDDERHSELTKRIDIVERIE